MDKDLDELHFKLVRRQLNEAGNKLVDINYSFCRQPSRDEQNSVEKMKKKIYS